MGNPLPAPSGTPARCAQPLATTARSARHRPREMYRLPRSTEQSFAPDRADNRSQLNPPQGHALPPDNVRPLHTFSEPPPTPMRRLLRSVHSYTAVYALGQSTSKRTMAGLMPVRFTADLDR